MGIGINVISFFDGMGCLYIALKELGIEVNNYYAYEIDKHAIKQSEFNFPKVKHMGSVKNFDIKHFDEHIDIFAGGSPCQGFSFAGKQLNFDDPRSALFFDFVNAWKEVKEKNPDAVFLLENVNMKKEYMKVISDYMGVFPVRLNSNLVSAQNRDRYYWSNISVKKEGLFGDAYTDVEQPLDRKILLKDILQPENEIADKFYLSDKMINHFTSKPGDFGKRFNPISDTSVKGNCINASTAKMVVTDNYICVAMRGRNPDNPSDRRTGSPTEQRLEPNINGKTNCLTTVAKDNLVMQINPSKESGGKQPYQHNRVYDINGHMPALMAELGGRNNVLIPESSNSACLKLRRLTPLECSRLQTVPSWYKWIVSDTQVYRMLGNGWTIEMIMHILEPMKKRNPTGEKALFEMLWQKSDQSSYVSGKPIREARAGNFAHVLSKGAYPAFRLNPDNIVLLTEEEHTLFDHGGKEGRDKYAKAYPNTDWDRLYTLKENLQEQYLKLGFR